MGKGTIEGAAAGAAMATAAEGFGDAGGVDFALAADAETELAGGGFAEEGGGLGAVDGNEVVDDALAVFGVGAGEGEVLSGDPGPGQGVAVLEVVKSGAEQANLTERAGEVDVAGDQGGVGAFEGEIVVDGEGLGGGSGEGKGSGVGEDGGVEAGGHRRGDVSCGRGDGE